MVVFIVVISTKMSSGDGGWRLEAGGWRLEEGGMKLKFGDDVI